jgi:hypothetical protein
MPIAVLANSIFLQFREFSVPNCLADAETLSASCDGRQVFGVPAANGTRGQLAWAGSAAGLRAMWEVGDRTQLLEDTWHGKN